MGTKTVEQLIKRNVKGSASQIGHSAGLKKSLRTRGLLPGGFQDQLADRLIGFLRETQELD